MAGSYRCVHGHSWSAGDVEQVRPAVAVHCPTCGAVGALIDSLGSTLELPAAPASTAERMDETIPSAAGGNGSAAEASLRSLFDAWQSPIRDSAVTEPNHLPAGRPPHQIPGYDLLSELGRGGMGVVYHAIQRDLNRPVALKMILSGAHAGERERERFRKEAAAVAALQHEHIVRIYEIGIVDDLPFLVFEYLDGGTLCKQMDGTPWNPRDAAALLIVLAQAIDYAHSRGIVHRDLKPANILLSAAPRPPAERAKISDFGLAKRLTETPTDLLRPDATPAVGPTGSLLPAEAGDPTRTGAVVGTPSYLAPEQAAGKNRSVGPPADIYALGAILYELLTGRPPFRGETPLDTVLQVLSDDPIPPGRLQPKIPRDLETICLKCLRKLPEQRYESAAALAEDLQRFQRGEAILARPIGTWERGIKWAKRRPGAAVGILATIFAVLSLLAVSLYFNLALKAAAEREQAEAAKARREQIETEKQKRAVEAQQQVVQQLYELAEKQKREIAEEARKADEARRKAIQSEFAVKKALEKAEASAQAASAESEKFRRSTYALQLMQVAALVERDPRRAAVLLDDPRRCPPTLRDFTWSYLRRRCRRLEAVSSDHEDTISGVAFSPDGRLTASCSWDQTIHLRDTRTNRLRAILRGHKGLVLSAVAFAPDGRTLASVGDDGTIRCWQVPGAIIADLLNPEPTEIEEPILPVEPWLTIRPRGDWVRAVAFHPAGTMLATAGSDRLIRLFALPGFCDRTAFAALAGGPATRPPTPQALPELKPLAGHTGTINSLAFAPDGLTLYSAGDDKTVRAWGIALHEGIVIHRAEYPIITCALSPDGSTLGIATSNPEHDVSLWSIKTLSEAARLRGHIRPVLALAFSPDGRTVATAGEDKLVRLWDAETGQARLILAGHENTIRALAFHPDRRSLVSAGNDKQLCVWSMQPPGEETLTLELNSRISTAFLTPDRCSLFVGTADGNIYLYRVSGIDDARWTITLHAVLRGHVGVSVTALALSDDGRTLASAALDRTIRLWDVGAHVVDWKQARMEAVSLITEERRLIHDLAIVRSLSWSHDGAFLAGAGNGGGAIWERKGRRVFTLPIGEPDRRVIASARFIPGTRRLIVAASRRLFVWNLETGEQEDFLMLLQMEPIEDLHIDADGETLALIDAAGNVELRDLRLREAPQKQRGFWRRMLPILGRDTRAKLSGHGNDVTALGFADDRRAIVTGSEDRTIRLWDPEGGQERATIIGHADRIVLTVLTGKTLLSLDRDGTVKRRRGVSDPPRPLAEDR